MKHGDTEDTENYTIYVLYISLSSVVSCLVNKIFYLVTEIRIKYINMGNIEINNYLYLLINSVSSAAPYLIFSCMR